jgi:MoxR-like ATPase
MKAALKKIQAIRAELEAAFMERQDEITSLLVAIIAKEHVLLLGPPGTAKSALARTVCKAIDGAPFFEWLLTKFSTPEELFGPVSFKGMENDEYRRITRDKLPEAQIGFLDEIFKANSAILNALLALVNERCFHNNGHPIQVPLVSVVGASNELPEKDAEGLEALYDRFMLRHWVRYVSDRDNMKSLLTSTTEPSINTKLTQKELSSLQSAVDAVTINDDLIESILTIKTELESSGLTASDRRWRRLIRIVKAVAVVNGRTDVDEDDLLILQHSLWREPDQLTLCRDKVGSVASPITAEALAILDAAKEAHTELLKSEGTPEFLMASVEMRSTLKEMRQRLTQRIAESGGASAKATKVLESIRGLQADVKRRADRAFD